MFGNRARAALRAAAVAQRDAEAAARIQAHRLEMAHDLAERRLEENKDLYHAYLAAREEVDHLHSQVRDLTAQVETMNRNWQRAISVGAAPRITATDTDVVHSACGNPVSFDPEHMSDGDPDHPDHGSDFYFAVCRHCDEDLFSFECERIR